MSDHRPSDLALLRESIDALRHGLQHLEREFIELRHEVHTMANGLTQELSDLVGAVSSLTTGVQALGPAIDHQFEQMLAAIAAGNDAEATVTAARAVIGNATAEVSSAATGVQAAVDKLAS